MKGDRIADPSHVLARFARRTLCDVRPGGDIYVTGAAFLWSKATPDDLGLSVNWLDRFPGNREKQLACVRDAMHLSPNASDRLALLEVRRTTDYLRSQSGLAISVIEDPTPPDPPRYPHQDPSHAVIAGWPDAALDADNAALIGDLIADNCVVESVLARAPRSRT